jgi:hypothetical protein
MAERITNTNGKRIGYLNFDLSDGESSGVVVLNVVPAVGYELVASPTDADVEIQARETGSGDPFVDIGASPIDLSAYTPETPVQFDFKAVAAATLTDVRRVAIFLAVSSQQAAGW